MTTVFLSGSRTISRINQDIRDRIDNMVRSNLAVVTGDANGADRAMQSYLHQLGYRNITIYFVGSAPRNNVGSWPTHNVQAHGRKSGREYYAQKDNEMARVADVGFVLWDGKSSGSVQNVLWLLGLGKPVVVYFAPEKLFYNVRTQGDLVEIFSRCDPNSLAEIGRKIVVPNHSKQAAQNQHALNF